MSYEVALNKAWLDIANLNVTKNLSVKFLGDEYSVDTENRVILSLACNVKTKDYRTILILHYLKKKISGLPLLSGNWKNFREIALIEGYHDTFRNRVLKPLIRKYGRNPEGISDSIKRFKARMVNKADVAFEVEVFEGVPVLIELWRQDEEFEAEANLLFDASITDIFCIEDIVVLAETVAAAL
ncbi:MAG: DUF3786 domain-containing protein [Candidatus Omnitrophota bacterium]|jgi:hypothetical protein|nr:MAG: DUF3786 domain-containing protein [Candidatus Omnitrophota bacterium]